MRRYFIADLHLDGNDTPRALKFREFLKRLAEEAQAGPVELYVLGDLFEYWAGDDDIPAPLHSKVCAALKSLADKKISISLIVGNRDFLIGDGFCAATGAVLRPDPDTQTIAGTPTVLLHGDTLCTDDIEYQQFRKQVHDPAFVKDFLHRSLAERKAYIENLRERSKSEKQVKSSRIMDVNNDAVIAAFRAANVTRMIHGHTHRLATHHYDIDGKACERWVLGDWGKTGNYLECSFEGWRFCAWDGKRATTIRS